MKCDCIVCSFSHVIIILFLNGNENYFMYLYIYKVFMFILVTNKFEYNLHNHIYVYLLVCAIFVTLDHYCCFQTCQNFVIFIHAGYLLSFTNETQLIG